MCYKWKERHFALSSVHLHFRFLEVRGFSRSGRIGFLLSCFQNLSLSASGQSILEGRQFLQYRLPQLERMESRESPLLVPLHLLRGLEYQFRHVLCECLQWLALHDCLQTQQFERLQVEEVCHRYSQSVFVVFGQVRAWFRSVRVLLWWVVCVQYVVCVFV